MPPAPVVEKPYLDITDIPMMPPAPVLELPELEIPNELEKPKEKEVIKVVKDVKKESKQGKTLPATGTNPINFTAVAIGLILVALVIKRRGIKDND